MLERKKNRYRARIGLENTIHTKDCNLVCASSVHSTRKQEYRGSCQARITSAHWIQVTEVVVMGVCTSKYQQTSRSRKGEHLNLLDFEKTLDIQHTVSW
jgi:hypothetical protein